MSASDRVIRHDADGLCTLTLNRPDKLNALDTESFQALERNICDLQSDEQVGCIVLRGAGGSFCAGADLNALTEGGEKPPPGYKPGIIERLSLLKQPVIAAVHGRCLTGGLELALACDFIVAEAGAQFADTHGKWGLVSAWGMSQRLPRRIGMSAAKRLMMTACSVDAAEALQIGLIDLLAPAGQLDQVLRGFAEAILANSWHTNFAAKRLMIETEGMSLGEGLSHENFRYPGFAADHLERIAAFAKKRGV